MCAGGDGDFWGAVLSLTCVVIPEVACFATEGPMHFAGGANAFGTIHRSLALLRMTS